MQQHVKLEVALEVIVRKIADVMNQLKQEENQETIQKLEKELQELMKLKEEAYQGNWQAVNKILEKGQA